MPVRENKSEKYRSYLNDGYTDCLATFSCVAVDLGRLLPEVSSLRLGDFAWLC